VVASDNTRRGRPLASYLDRGGARREVIAWLGAGASLLIVDRDALTRTDPRLVAHLGPDEPFDNAEAVSTDYVLRMTREPFRCRPVRRADLSRIPNLGHCDPASGTSPRIDPRVGTGDGGVDFRLHAARVKGALAHLRWWRVDPCGGSRPVSLREVIATLESYEPVRSLTIAALAPREQRYSASMAVLRAELKRVLESPIVLNRGLREAVLAKVEHAEISMSEIAIRCGRTKRDPNGNVSGETSWLARRLGLLPEGGKSEPTPWIHSDVLALIARSGIGIAPREVEL
jgi:hypothetical protein